MTRPRPGYLDDLVDEDSDYRPTRGELWEWEHPSAPDQPRGEDR